MCGNAKLSCGGAVCDCSGNFESLDYRRLSCIEGNTLLGQHRAETRTQEQPTEDMSRMGAAADSVRWQRCDACHKLEHKRSGPKLVLVVVSRDEHEYISDWLLYHRALGVHSFVLVSNQCDRESHQRLLNTITSLPCPVAVEILHGYRCAKRFQTAAYRAAINHLWLHRERLSLEAHQTRVGFIDVDEFLVVGGEPRVSSHGTVSATGWPLDVLFQRRLGCAALDGRCGACAAAPMWTIGTTVFGTSMFGARPTMGPTPANFVLAAAEACNSSSCLGPDLKNLYDHQAHKSICLLSELIARSNVTFPGADGAWVHECLPTHLGVALPASTARLNHYFTKSKDEYTAKLNRGRADFPRAKYPALVDEALWSDHVDLHIIEQLAQQHAEHRRPGHCLREWLRQRVANRTALPIPAAAMLRAHCADASASRRRSHACAWLGVSEL